MKRFVPLLIFLALCALMARPLLMGKDPSVLPSALVGRTAPVLPGGSLSSEGIVIVNFFASWCVPCAAEQKVLVGLKGAADIYGVAYKDKQPAIRDWLKEHGNPYKRVDFDGDGRIAIEWGVYGVPETFVVDRGRVVYRHAGPLTAAQAAREISPLLKGVAR